MSLKIQIKPQIRQHIKSIHDVLTFGQHRGCTVSDVIHDDPAYLTWLQDKGIVAIEQDVMEIIWMALENKHDNFISGNWEDYGYFDPPY